jgi:hypothetical protein
VLVRPDESPGAAAICDKQIQRRCSVICQIWFLFLFGRRNEVKLIVIFENSFREDPIVDAEAQQPT